MRTMMNGLSGWVRMRDTKSDSLRVLDLALTVVGTLLVVATWVVVRRYVVL